VTRWPKASGDRLTGLEAIDMSDDDEPLIAEMMPVLDIDHQYVKHVEEWNQELVDQIRRCGRAAGRRLGFKIRTFATDPDVREDRRRVVCVVVTASTEEDERRIEERSQLLVAQALSSLFDPPGT